MHPLSPSSPALCIPFEISDGESVDSAWLGGRPPLAAASVAGQQGLRFFATVPLTLEPDLSVSIFEIGRAHV